MTIKELRKSLGLTQKEVAQIVKIPLRTYKNYENDSDKTTSIKYEYIQKALEEYGRIDEEKGVLTLERIKNVIHSVLQNYEIEYCYLFGSYAKNSANEKSDVDLLISTKISGLEFFGLVEELRNTLKKKIDLLTLDQLKDNQALLNEILKDGIKLYR
ncbi:MAG: nucleotidyltransferase [Tenericutes bacterium HGW-Tenericutes-2]|nr:MAG: nucleotidyltransferase [Tenericutes bacterium HGW-Tenericutes-2]